MISASHKVFLNNILFLYLADLWFHPALCDIRGELDVKRPLLLSYKCYQDKEEGVTRNQRTRDMPEVDDKPHYNHAERREVKPVWFEVLEEIVLESCNNVEPKRTKRKSPAM
jgi:hypothetical protein